MTVFDNRHAISDREAGNGSVYSDATTLTGRNPMPEPFTTLLALATPELRPIMLALRDLILLRDGGAVEIVRIGDRAASYGPGSKKMSEAYVFIQPHRRWVNLGFYRGTSLPDPMVLLTGTGARLRHVKIAAFAATSAAALADLLDAAKTERCAALGHTPPQVKK